MNKWIICCLIFFVSIFAFSEEKSKGSQFNFENTDENGLNIILEQENKSVNDFFLKNNQLDQVIFKELENNQVITKKENCKTEQFKNNNLKICYIRGFPSFYIQDKNGTQWSEIYSVLPQNSHYFKSNSQKISDDGQWLIISQDLKGTNDYTIKIFNIKNKQIETNLENTNGMVVFLDNSNRFYYVANDKNIRGYQVRLYDIAKKSDQVIYESHLQSHSLGIYKTFSRKYLVINESGLIDSQSFIVNLTQNPEKFQLFKPLSKGVEYYLSQVKDKFYIRSNIHNGIFSIYETDDPKFEKWNRVSPQNKNIEDYAVLKDYIVFLTKEKGVPVVIIYNKKNLKTHLLKFRDPNYLVELKTLDNDSNNILKYSYTSFTTPNRLIEKNLDNEEETVLEEDSLKSNYNPNDYENKYFFVKSSDNTKVPVSLIYKKNLFKKKQNPLILTAYGAYGSAMDARFSSNILTMLNRGFVYAVIHTRGGNELGENWYLEGKLLNKKNTFEDFIAVTKSLQKLGYGTPKRTYAMGASAGGLIMGYIINNAPHLYRAVVAQKPLVDLIAKVSDETLPQTVAEYDEWGNPKIKKYFDYIKSYSPYDNVTPKKFPAIFTSAAKFDRQVNFRGPLKWVIKLRKNNLGNNPILFRTEMKTGHSYGQNKLKELAEVFAFIIITDSQNNKQKQK